MVSYNLSNGERIPYDLLVGGTFNIRIHQPFERHPDEIFGVRGFVVPSLLAQYKEAESVELIKVEELI